MNQIVLSESDYQIIKQCLENVIFNSMYLPEKHEAQMALHRLERAYDRIDVREKSGDKKRGGQLMSTVIRPEVSKKNEFYVEKNRYYELRHFVMQYHDWTRWLKEYSFRYSSVLYPEVTAGSESKVYASNPTAEEVERRDKYLSRIKLVQDCCYEAFNPCEGFGYILRAITLGRSYEWLVTNYDFTMSRDRYYKCYRKFYWLLDKRRE